MSIESKVKGIGVAMAFIGALGIGTANAHNTPTLQDGFEQKNFYEPSFFDSFEVSYSDNSRFWEWNDVLKRYANESKEKCVSIKKTPKACYSEIWKVFLDGIRGKSKWDQLVAVNNYANLRKYEEDSSNWGKREYWATPGEFFTRGRGDCEDYAIAKFISLRELGWPSDELRIVGLIDSQKNIGHAVLVAYHDRKTWALDNRIKFVIETKKIKHYSPIYSLNKEGWWAHFQSRKKD